MNAADVSMRPAAPADLRRIIELLIDDPLGRGREELTDPLPAEYRAAFEAIESDPNNEVIVVTRASAVIGVMQLTFIPSLTHRGGWRMQIEGVRVAEEARGGGVGRTMIRWAIERAAERRCRIVQLTSDKHRPTAIRFYESLGFKATHEGMKLQV